MQVKIVFGSPRKFSGSVFRLLTCPLGRYYFAILKSPEGGT